MSDSFEQPCKYCDDPKPTAKLTKGDDGKWTAEENKDGKWVAHQHNNKKQSSGNWPKKPQITVNINITVADSDTLKTVLGLIKEVQG